MAQRKQRNKLSPLSFSKIQARYEMKKKEFSLLTPEEMEEKLKEKKSRTDQLALKHAFLDKVKEAEKTINPEVEENGTDTIEVGSNSETLQTTDQVL